MENNTVFKLYRENCMKELFFLKVNILILTIRLDCESVLLEYVTGIKKSEFLFVSQNITTKNMV